MICESCQSIIADNARFCRQCGIKVVNIELLKTSNDAITETPSFPKQDKVMPTDKLSGATSKTQPNTITITCERCQSIIADNARFCRQCGAMVVKIELLKTSDDANIETPSFPKPGKIMPTDKLSEATSKAHPDDLTGTKKQNKALFIVTVVGLIILLGVAYSLRETIGNLFHRLPFHAKEDVASVHEPETADHLSKDQNHETSSLPGPSEKVTTSVHQLKEQSVKTAEPKQKMDSLKNAENLGTEYNNEIAPAPLSGASQENKPSANAPEAKQKIGSVDNLGSTGNKQKRAGDSFIFLSKKERPFTIDIPFKTKSWSVVFLPPDSKFKSNCHEPVIMKFNNKEIKVGVDGHGNLGENAYEKMILVKGINGDGVLTLSVEQK